MNKTKHVANTIFDVRLMLYSFPTRLELSNHNKIIDKNGINKAPSAPYKMISNWFTKE